MESMLSIVWNQAAILYSFGDAIRLWQFHTRYQVMPYDCGLDKKIPACVQAGIFLVAGVGLEPTAFGLYSPCSWRSLRSAKEPFSGCGNLRFPPLLSQSITLQSIFSYSPLKEKAAWLTHATFLFVLYRLNRCHPQKVNKIKGF